jgi:hypothetical protein
VEVPYDVSFLSSRGDHRDGLQEQSRSMDPEGLSTGIRRMIGQFNIPPCRNCCAYSLPVSSY